MAVGFGGSEARRGGLGVGCEMGSWDGVGVGVDIENLV